jgi:hypothetical protein
MGTINTHRSKSGVITYRARIQRKGQQTLSATFRTLKDARKWLTLREADILAGRHFPEKKARHTLNELFDHYQRDVMPLKDPETQRNQGYTIQYWRGTFGHRYLDEIQPQSNILSPCQTGTIWNVSFSKLLLSNRGFLISPQTNRS